MAKRQKKSASAPSIGQRLSLVSEWILLRHGRIISYLVLVSGLVVAGYLALELFMTDPPATEAVTNDAQPRLDTATIDTITTWIEERGRQNESGFVIDYDWP